MSLEPNSMLVDRLTKSCRLCLTVHDKLYHIFCSDDTDTLAVSLSMKVTLCTTIAISKYDKLPQKICLSCLNYINEWYKFRRKCIRNNNALKQISEKCCNENTTNCHDSSLEVITIQESGVANKRQSCQFDNDKLADDFKDLTEAYDEPEFKKSAKLPAERKRKFKCSLCPDSFYFSKDLKLHKTYIHNCLKSTLEKNPQIPDSEIKLEAVNMRSRYEMKCCNKVFFSKIKFRKHYHEKHPGEKPFMCETCGKKDFISEETLKRHKVLHTGKFRCEICSKTFTCNAILILHKRDKHENDKPFVCDVCGKRFVTELLMNYHKRFHTGEKKYVCEECGLAVVTSSSLAKHKRIHTKEKPHVCHICDKGFIIKGRLIEHLRVHTGERPYVCNICQKGFTMRDKLKRHTRVHSGEKLFSCEYCGNNYSTRYGLSVHLKSHLGK